MGKLPNLPIDVKIGDSEERKRIVGDLNEAICDWVLGVLASRGYEARDVNRGDTYFIFSGYDCSVVSFRLSKVWSGWLFGLWINGEELLDGTDGEVIQLFCQHEAKIDKFKPSASEMCVSIARDEFEAMLEDPHPTDWRGNRWDPFSARLIVMFADQIRLHPLLSFSGIKSYYPIDYRPSIYYAKYVSVERRNEFRKRLSTKMLNMYLRDKCEVANSLPFVKKCSYKDRGDRCYPRMRLVCVLDGEPTEEQQERILEVFPKARFGGRSFYEAACHIEVVFEKDGEWWCVEPEEEKK